MLNSEEMVTGDVAFAYGAIAAGVSVVTGYPGSPSSGTVKALLEMSETAGMHITWAVNECIAMEMVSGASIAGRRALLCVKSVGLNVALDPLMTVVLTGCRAGLVILLGDDPGGWASQNEQDTRLLSVMAHVPLLEPATPQEAQDTLIAAFDLSERHGIPVIVREVRALALSEGPVRRAPTGEAVVRPYVPDPGRWLSLPSNVVENHRRLHEKLRDVSEEFETSPLNRIEGEGELGIVACGATYTKLTDSVGDEVLSRIRVLKLGTFNPLPRDFVEDYISRVSAALVLEETEPYVEQELWALAAQRGLDVTILGRNSGHVPVGGELSAFEIISAIGKLLPDLTGGLVTPEGVVRAMPSQTPFCSGCPYTPLFETLVECIEAEGGRQRFIVVGEAGCMVRACRPPYELLDVKMSLGSGIGLAVGVALAEPGSKVIALAGDSSFLHHSWGGLVEAVRNDVDLLVILLDNGTTAMSGRQPHAGTARNARQIESASIDVEDLVRAAGVREVSVIDPFDGGQTHRALKAALARSGPEVIVSRSPCALLG